MIAIGGLVEVMPLFYLRSTIETADGMRPYTPLELAGRNIYVSEGCYLCHSQMIRALRDEVERYGHYSLAAESEYDHPFQWGSKRNGPDLARVGGKYSDDWHRDHLKDPRAVVPGSIMPAYAWLFTTDLDYQHVAEDMKVQADLGVPYSDDDDRKCAGRRPHAGDRQRAGCRRAGEALPESAVARFRRQSGPYHRCRCLDRLLADAGNAGRLQALQRQSQYPLRRRNVSPTYAFFSHFAQTWGMVYFILIFVVVLAYALWPSRQKQFDEQARMPLRED